MVHQAKAAALKFSSFSLQLGVAASLCLMSQSIIAHASDTAIKSLSVELNTAQQVGEKCRLVFVVSNKSDTDINKLSLETVLFDIQGVFKRLTLFDFKRVPSGKPRVRQFVMPKTECNTLGRLLINGVSACEIADTKSPRCEENLELKSRSKIELVG